MERFLTTVTKRYAAKLERQEGIRTLAGSYSRLYQAYVTLAP